MLLKVKVDFKTSDLSLKAGQYWRSEDKKLIAQLMARGFVEEFNVTAPSAPQSPPVPKALPKEKQKVIRRKGR